ncbi:MAG: hypothetical protein AAFU67_09765 [Bacteroidota bacterium]
MLQRLRRGHSSINEVYAKRLLSKIGEIPSSRPKKTVQVISEPPIGVTDPDFLKLQSHISTLFGRRAKLSNSFHDCKNYVERANVSDDIRIVQNKISAALKKRRHFKRHGVVPKDVSNEEKPLPEGVELMRAYQACGKRKSLAKKNIKKWAAVNTLEGKRKLAEAEKKFKIESDEFDRLSQAIRQKCAPIYRPS